MKNNSTDEMNHPAPMPLIPHAPLAVLPMGPAGPRLQISYADAALREKASRLSMISCIVAVCAIPITVATNFAAAQVAPNWRDGSVPTVFIVTHLTCLIMGLRADLLIKQIKGRRADVVMSGIAIALGGSAIVLPLLFFLGLLIMRLW